MRTKKPQIEMVRPPPEALAKLPIAGCVAHLQDYIIKAIADNAITLGPIARWSAGDTDVIYITGRLALTGYFDRYGIRWLCPTLDSKGLFGKGYVTVKPFVDDATQETGYRRLTEEENFDRIKHLPLTK